MSLHTEPQDTECEPWKRLLALVEEAAADRREVLIPLSGMNVMERAKIVTLPATIAKLKSLKCLVLYNSNLVRIPPEIGEMESLEQFDVYTSYRLHWFPYEITRCKMLRDSKASTRALYGNYKYRPPLPRLTPSCPTTPYGEPTRNCSVCGRSFIDQQRHRVWITLRVATDDLPLLVNACSKECVQSLPKPPDRYLPRPHRGGKENQPPRKS
jgi:hypothetical protein